MMPNCPNCGNFMVKNGRDKVFRKDNRLRVERKKFLKLRKTYRKQNYICTECGETRTNIGNYYPGFKYPRKIIAEAIHRHCKRETWPDIALDMCVDKDTMYHWEKYFDKLLHDYDGKSIVKERLKKGEYSGIWHIDRFEFELRGVIGIRKEKRIIDGKPKVVKIKEYRKVHLWTCIDNGTRTVLGWHVSLKKEAIDCDRFLKKLHGLPRPIRIHTDAEKVFRKQIDKHFNKDKNKFKTRVEYIDTNMSDDSEKKYWGLNNVIERYHQKIRSRLDYRRKLESVETARIFFNMFNLDYNFVIVHDELVKTPAEQAGIGVPKLGKRRHMEDVLAAFITDDMILNYQGKTKPNPKSLATTNTNINPITQLDVVLGETVTATPTDNTYEAIDETLRDLSGGVST